MLLTIYYFNIFLNKVIETKLPFIKYFQLFSVIYSLIS